MHHKSLRMYKIVETLVRHAHWLHTHMRKQTRMQQQCGAQNQPKASVAHPMILQPQFEDWIEALHVLGERLATHIRQSPDRQDSFFMHTSSVALEDTNEGLHDGVCLL